VSGIELSKKMASKAPASKTAISVSGAGSSSERSAHHTTQGTAQFMAQALLRSTENQQDSAFVHLPQHDLESLVYVLAYAVVRRNVATRSSQPRTRRTLRPRSQLSSPTLTRRSASITRCLVTGW
jgi:hypothetical protein